MSDLRKYRLYSNLAMSAMALFLLLSGGAIWNSLIKNNIAHIGWIIVFVLLLFIAGAYMFRITYITTNAVEYENNIKNSYDSGRMEILNELASKKAEEDLKAEEKTDDLEETIQSLLSGLKNIKTKSGFCNKTLSILANKFGFVQGLMYIREENQYSPYGEFALTGQKPKSFKAGENLNGQVAVNKTMMILYDVPENYFTVTSGLGSSKPRFLIIVPVLSGDECVGIIELSSFSKPDNISRTILDKLSSELGNRLNKFVAA